MGAKVVAVSDVSGGIYNPDGLDLPAVDSAVNAHPRRLLEGYTARDVERINNEELLETKVDVLIPAALEHQIRGDNADKLHARYIVEGANGPTTREADEILHEKGVIVVPDILANAGGVAVSYLEWVQNLQNFYWEEDEINQRLTSIMKQSFAGVWDYAQAQDVPMRLGALMLAVDKVAEAVQQRGIWP